MKFFVLVAFIAAAASAVPLEYQPSLNFGHPEFSGEKGNLRIVGGEEVPPHAVPYQVGLFLSNSFCSGSLINRRYVLTSAHCAELSNRPVVVLGAHNIKAKEKEQVILVSTKVIVHPHWDQERFVNDVALIMLPQDVTFNNEIAPIQLVPSNVGSYENEQARVTGWGVTRDGSNDLSEVLRYVINPIISNRECQKKFGSRITVTPNHMCLSGDYGRSPCKGDAGAPVVARYQSGLAQVGIVSFMMEDACQKGFPAGLTRISSYYQWIMSNM